MRRRLQALEADGAARRIVDTDPQLAAQSFELWGEHANGLGKGPSGKRNGDDHDDGEDPPHARFMHSVQGARPRAPEGSA